MNLGILDLGTILLEKETSVNVVNNTFSNVVLAEELGFSRYWFAEHHAPDTAWRNTSLMVALAAGYTEKIKIGSAGVIIGINSPYRIAHDFRLASSLYNDRIELGISRGSVTKKYLEFLSNDKIESIKDLDLKYNQLIEFVNNQHKTISIPPYDIKPPTIFTLGSSLNSMQYSIKYNTNLCISIFHGTPFDDGLIENLNLYKDLFYRTNNSIPKISICFSGVCSENDDLAKKRLTDFLPKESTWDVNVIGSPDKFKDYLYNISQKSGINDFVYCDMSQSIYKHEHMHSIIKIIQ